MSRERDDLEKRLKESEAAVERERAHSLNADLKWVNEEQVKMIESTGNQAPVAS